MGVGDRTEEEGDDEEEETGAETGGTHPLAD